METKKSAKKTSEKAVATKVVKKVAKVQKEAKAPKTKKEAVKATIKKEFKDAQKVEKRVPAYKLPIKDFDMDSCEKMLELYGNGKLYTSKEFVGTGYCGIRKDMASKKLLASAQESAKLETNLLKEYQKQVSTTIQKLDDVLKFKKPVKGVCYTFNSKLVLDNHRVQTHSILKLSKWVAIDSRVRKCFPNHSFAYINEVNAPILIVNNETNRVDGYFVPNQAYWDNNHGDITVKRQV